jgi:hypothetical protein
MLLRFLRLSPVVILIVICFSQLMMQSGCRRLDNKGSIARIDTLERLMQKIQGTLIIDQDAIQKRLDSMKIKMDVVKQHPADTADAEKKSAFMRYEGIYKNYQDFLRDYPLAQFDADKAAKEVSRLKKAVIDKQVSQQDFDKEYIREKSSLDELNERVKGLAFRTYSEEGDYNRADGMMTKMFHAGNMGK